MFTLVLICLYCFSWESYRSPLCFCFSTRLTSEEKGKESRESISFELGAPHYDLSMIVTRLLEKFVSNYRFTEIEIDRIWRIERLSTLKNPNDREIVSRIMEHGNNAAGYLTDLTNLLAKYQKKRSLRYLGTFRHNFK